VRAFGARYESTYRQICVRGLRPLQGESASGSESAREFENCVVRRSDRRVDLEVVSGVLVGGYRLSARETSESVAAHSVPLLSDLRGTPDADPDDVDAGERTGPVVRARLVDDDFVDNEFRPTRAAAATPAWYARSNCRPTPPTRTLAPSDVRSNRMPSAAAVAPLMGSFGSAGESRSRSL
jgi:hypothetical protein